MYHMITLYTSVYHQEMGIIMHSKLFYIMLSLNQNTIYPQNLTIYFYTYLRPIDSINFPKQLLHLFLSPVYSYDSKDKTYSPVM